MSMTMVVMRMPGSRLPRPLVVGRRVAAGRGEGPGLGVFGDFGEGRAGVPFTGDHRFLFAFGRARGRRRADEEGEEKRGRRRNQKTAA
jgi:hypothetical protein